MEAARRQAMLDRMPTEPELEQLPSGNDPALLPDQ
jgi:hypothetical protein